MEAVGLVSSIISLVQAASAIIQTIGRLRLNYPQRCSHLLKLAQELDRVLQSAGGVSEPAAELVSSSLKDVQSTLDSLAEPGIRRTASRIAGGCFGVSGDEAKLIGAEKKLEILAAQVVVQANFLQLRRQIPQIFNDRMELPLSPIGLDRAKPILDFLEASKAEEFRVVGIHGLPGVGKSTLLKYIWNEVSSKSPFLVRAHVQIGHNTPSEKLCPLQSSILEQLGGGRIEFTSCDGGRQKLHEHFDKLRGNKQPVFLAIDNVFDVNHMIQLLPSSLSKDLLPASSCIVVTCRGYAVIRALLNTCHLNEKNHSQVFCHSPACLDIDESKAVFAACGDLSPLGDAELLDALVPLCKGLPLALSVLGRTFAGEARRERKEWESIAEQMQVLDGEGAETSPVIKSLKISYDLLSESRKAAFLDVVNVFYGWPWDRVERILGVKVMKELKDSSLISVADDWSKCNQSALRLGYGHQKLYNLHIPAVMMHDLILKFGEYLPHNIPVTRQTFTGFQSLDNFIQDLEAPKLRNLVLLNSDQQQGLDKFLERTTNLQTLVADFSKPWSIGGGEISIGVMNHTIHMRSQSLQSLRCLSLVRWQFSRLPMETKLSQLREMHLYGCNNVIQLPKTPLCQLEWLSIRKCANFQGFSRYHVQNWQKLQHLEVSKCNNVTTIPTDLGYLKNLTSLVFRHLRGLKTFPDLFCPCLRRLQLTAVPITNLHLETSSLEYLDICCDNSPRGLPEVIRNALALQELRLSNCDSLEELPDEVGQLTSLRELNVQGCKNLKQLPRAIGNASSLESLSLSNCDSLEELPDEVGQLTSLRVLVVKECKNLKQLPRAIGNASSLESLNLRDCGSLEELPDEVGQLTSLRKLDVEGCKNLKQLPRAIGNASSLESLSWSDCVSLEELPDEVGQLTSLRKLAVEGCKNLKQQLPRAIRNASSLESLSLSNCNCLEELPDEVGQLTSLRELDVKGCKNLKQLPRAIGNASSLKILRLSNCDGLEELPDEVGQLTSLRILAVKECKNLKQLPRAIGYASSLEGLGLSNCDSLKELPDEVVQLTSLRALDVEGCKNLKQLPRAIGNASSLKLLRLSNCDGLEELPDEVGQLTSLIELDVKRCKNLKQLPRAIGNASSLEMLRLRNCDSLEELPDEVGQLTWLKTLDVEGCKNLKQLPRAIGNASYLESLSLRNCDSLEELPDEVEQLTLLRRLDLSNCCNLKRLPQAIVNASSLEVLR